MTPELYSITGRRKINSNSSIYYRYMDKVNCRTGEIGRRYLKALETIHRRAECFILKHICFIAIGSSDETLFTGT